eukprot:scaffold1813_cov134-Skeletonema_dohrnii-CCMP3373.AAC.3
MMCCAACGNAEVDDIKLRKCTACYLVKYCSVKCQKEHRPQHKKECKKRAAELRDKILFKQCCSKFICKGCCYANDVRELEGKLQPKCPFCRHPNPNSDVERERNTLMVKRVEANDPVALYQMGGKRHQKGDYDGAFQYWTKAAALGHAGAHFNLSIMYQEGQGVEENQKKEVYHLEEAAIGGNPYARHNLAIVEGKSGRYERAMKHDIIAANLGHDNSLEHVIEGFKAGLVSKEDFAATLRAHQAAVDATKTAQREEAEAGRRVM